MLDRFEKFSLAVSEINKYWHKLAGEEMAVYGLKSAHCIYLFTLYKNPQGLTATELSRSSLKDKADVSRMMRELEEKGLVQKHSVGTNRYGAKYTMTPLGQNAGQHIYKRASQAVDYVGETLSEEDRTTFYNALETIMNRMIELSEKGFPQE